MRTSLLKIISTPLLILGSFLSLETRLDAIPRKPRNESPSLKVLKKELEKSKLLSYFSVSYDDFAKRYEGGDKMDMASRAVIMSICGDKAYSILSEEEKKDFDDKCNKEDLSLKTIRPPKDDDELIWYNLSKQDRLMSRKEIDEFYGIFLNYETPSIGERILIWRYFVLLDEYKNKNPDKRNNFPPYMIKDISLPDAISK